MCIRLEISRSRSLVLAAAFALTAATAGAQVPAGPMTLEQVLRLAEERSESIDVASAGVRRAQGQQARARSGLYPQLNMTASYDRTLATEFSGLFNADAGSTCPPFNPDPAGTIEARVAEIERAVDCGAVGSNLFGNGTNETTEPDDSQALPFGRANTWRLNLSFSQNLFSGGRNGAQRDVAMAGRDSADLALTSARAQLLFQTTQAYYDAALSDRLVEIALETVRQSELTLRQAQVRFDAGTVPEFELLRARVGRDNLNPVVIRQRANRHVAYLRLKQLLDLPVDANLQLAVSLSDAELPPAAFAPRLVAAEAAVANALAAQTPEPPASALSETPRLAVRDADAVRRLREASFRLTAAQRRPTVSLNSAFGRVAYPSGWYPSWNSQRTNWTVGASMQWPVLTGGRQRADEAIARADLDQAQSQLRLATELSTLDGEAAWAEMVAARASWSSSAGTVEQATRAYQIAEARYAAGVSTQLELADSRLLLVQAEANRAQAARDLQVARARIALLPDLPLSSAGGQGTTASPPTGPTSTPQATPQPGAPTTTTGTGTQFTGGASSTPQTGVNR
jgi:outer membrane protein TolC